MLRECMAVVALHCVIFVQCGEDLNNLDLPPEHAPHYFLRFPVIKNACVEDVHCVYRNFTEIEKCWGYEDVCPEDKKDTIHECTSEAALWRKDEQERLDVFWNTADFGYIKKRLNELHLICKPKDESGSSLLCARHARYCKASNLVLDFRNAKLNLSSDRFREDVFKRNEIGGRCALDQTKLKVMGDHKSALQSWFAEMENYSELDSDPLESSEKLCDIILSKPTVFMKLDAGVNMFHHFCDFINLYASQHINGSFDRDIQIVMWDTSGLQYGDIFESTWKAFTNLPVLHLNRFDGKRVCVEDAMFSLLPRMRYGLYYNMPLIPGCWKSNLFRAFSRHLMHRLDIPQSGPHPSKVRVLLLTRSTDYRRILNQDELLKALISSPKIEATIVDYNRDISFMDQLYVTHNSDIFIGMHGAGLTHLLFLPNWGAVFELYNCDDKDCYYDLSRLRGLKYITWEDDSKLVQQDEGHHPKIGAHKKFTNYSFDVEEFARLVSKAVKHVEGHREFIEARREKHPSTPTSPVSREASDL